jgi:hypothetical protein
MLLNFSGGRPPLVEASLKRETGTTAQTATERATLSSMTEEDHTEETKIILVLTAVTEVTAVNSEAVTTASEAAVVTGREVVVKTMTTITEIALYRDNQGRISRPQSRETRPMRSQSRSPSPYSRSNDQRIRRLRSPREADKPRLKHNTLKELYPRMRLQNCRTVRCDLVWFKPSFRHCKCALACYRAPIIQNRHKILYKLTFFCFFPMSFFYFCSNFCIFKFMVQIFSQVLLTNTYAQLHVSKITYKKMSTYA